MTHSGYNRNHSSNMNSAETPNHALQRTGARVTPAAPPPCRLASLAHHAAQPSRHARRSLSLGSLGVSLAPSVNDTFLSRFRTDAFSNSETYDCASVLASELLPSRSFHAASALSTAALPDGRSLRLRRWLPQVRRFLCGHPSARRSPFSTRTPQAVAIQPRTPNHALQRTRVSVTPAASSLRLSPAAQQSRPSRVSLSLRSLGVLAPLPRT